MAKSAKTKWEDVFKDFKNKYPSLRTSATKYEPYDYLTILIHFKDGKQMIYDYATHTGSFTK